MFFLPPVKFLSTTWHAFLLFLANKRNQPQERVPVLSVVGEKELKAGTLAVRARGNLDLGDVPVDELIAKMLEADDAAKELHEFLEPKPKEEAVVVDVETEGAATAAAGAA